MGGMTMISTTHSFPPDMSVEDDIDQFAHDRVNGIGNKINTENGTATAILELAPNVQSPMHRTLTMDVIVVIEGVIELELDSGEKRTLQVGDSVIQRATMHKWYNRTPNDGRARMVGIAHPIKEPLEIAGKKLETEFLTG